MHDALIKDLEHMEEACERTANRTDIWQDRIIYWMAVALVHIITWILRKEQGPARVSYDGKRDQYAVYRGSRLVGYALDVQAVGDLLRLDEARKGK